MLWLCKTYIRSRVPHCWPFSNHSQSGREAPHFWNRSANILFRWPRPLRPSKMGKTQLLSPLSQFEISIECPTLPRSRLSLLSFCMGGGKGSMRTATCLAKFSPPPLLPHISPSLLLVPIMHLLDFMTCKWCIMCLEGSGLNCAPLLGPDRKLQPTQRSGNHLNVRNRSLGWQ